MRHSVGPMKLLSFLMRRIHRRGRTVLPCGAACFCFIFFRYMRARVALSFVLLACVAGALPQYQKDSLWAFHIATNGQSWFSNNWNYSTDPCGPPAWTGVGCNLPGTTVLGLNLSSKNLSGTLSDLLLPDLTSLYGSMDETFATAH